MGTDFTVAEDLHRRTNTVTPSAGGLGTHEVGQAYSRQQQPANSQVFNSLVNTSGGRLHSVSQHIAFLFLIFFCSNRPRKIRMGTLLTDGYCSSRSRLWSEGSWVASERKVASDPRLATSAATSQAPIIGISPANSWRMRLWTSLLTHRCSLLLKNGRH